MTSLNSSGPLGNILTRLQGLKNVSGRRVMPGAEFLKDLENVDTDVSGTSQPLPNFSNFVSPTQNLPESDLGGELTPQSYDVRANSVNTQDEQSPPEESGFFSRLGQALADYVNPKKREEVSMANQSMMNRAQGQMPQATPQAPPIATAEVDEQEGLPPVTASQQEFQPEEAQPSRGVLGAIADYFSPTQRSKTSEENTDLIQNAQLMAQGKNPEEVRGQFHENLNQDVEKAMENPWQYAAYGSAEQVANSPALQAQFKQVTGIDYEPQIAQQVSQHEEAMQGVEDALNGIHTQLSDQANQIKERILSNQSTDSDKYFIGLALLMPLLVGGLFGKEAAIGALGGGAQGIANILGRRQSEMREDEGALLDIAKQQGSNQEKLANIGLEKAKLGPSLRKNLPEDPNKHVIGMESVEWKDPATGNPMKGIKLMPGLVARSEYVNTPDGLKNMQKAANELSEVKTYTDEINDLTDDIVGIVSQLKDKNAFSKAFTSLLSGKVPGSLSKLTQDVDFEGRKVNAGVLLEEKLGFLANAYGMAKELGQLDRAAQNHINKIISNPTTTLLTPEDTLNQVLEVRKLAQRGLVRSATNKGFYPEFIIQDLESRNNELFGGLNQRSQDKRTADVKRKLLQNETNYAK